MLRLYWVLKLQVINKDYEKKSQCVSTSSIKISLQIPIFFENDRKPNIKLLVNEQKEGETKEQSGA